MIIFIDTVARSVVMLWTKLPQSHYSGIHRPLK